MPTGVFLESYIIPSERLLSISWELGPGVTPTNYNISYHNTNIQCFNDTHKISDIDVGHTKYNLTGLEEGSEYSVSINVQICEIEEVSEKIIISSTLPNGQLHFATLFVAECLSTEANNSSHSNRSCIKCEPHLCV